jgi:nitroreductase
MDAMEAILTRRSVRKFTNQPVSEELITEILRAAMFAPSAGNQQPWQFIVLTDHKLMDKIPAFHPYADMLPHCPVAIVVCGDPRLEKHKGFWIEDCSAATQNLLIAAHALGLGAVWVSAYPEKSRVEGLQKLLNLPSEIIPLSLIPIGYPAQETAEVDRFNPERIHWMRP